MNISKKLAFAPLFLISFVTTLFQLKPVIYQPYFLFSFSLEGLISLITITVLIILTSLLFVVFIALANDFKVVLAIILVPAVLPFMIFSQNLGIVLAIGVVISLLFSFLLVQNTLKTYIEFKPTTLFSSPIKNLTTILILLFSFAYFLSANQDIKKNGFEVPDSLIEAVLNFSIPQEITNVKGVKIAQVSLTSEQIRLLKQNPELLEQYGLDPSVLDQIEAGSQPQTVTQPISSNTQTPSFQPLPLDKSLVKSQLENSLKPYINYIPLILAAIFFLTLKSFAYILSILISPLLWVIFYILEKVGFVKFTQEMRPVRKMVI